MLHVELRVSVFVLGMVWFRRVVRIGNECVFFVSIGVVVLVLVLVMVSLCFFVSIGDGMVSSCFLLVLVHVVRIGACW